MKQIFTFLYYSLQQANQLPILSVTKGASDIKSGYYAVRIGTADKHGRYQALPEIFMAEDIEQVRDVIPDDCYRIERDPNDDPVIVETWI